MIARKYTGISVIVLCAAIQSAQAQSYDINGRAHAPAGGGWYNGQYYAGGQYLPGTQYSPTTQYGSAQVPSSIYATPTPYQNWINSNMIPGYAPTYTPSWDASYLFYGANMTGYYTPRRHETRARIMARTQNQELREAGIEPRPKHLKPHEFAPEFTPAQREALITKARSESDRIENDPEIQAELARIRNARGTYYGDPGYPQHSNYPSLPRPLQLYR